jgi:hypothetical protein
MTPKDSWITRLFFPEHQSVFREYARKVQLIDDLSDEIDELRAKNAELLERCERLMFGDNPMVTVLKQTITMITGRDVYGSSPVGAPVGVPVDAANPDGDDDIEQDIEDAASRFGAGDEDFINSRIARSGVRAG